MNIREKLRYYVNNNESSTDLKHQIASYIIDKTRIKYYPTMSQIADACFTTKSSITRFCNYFGFEGYKEFIYKLKYEDETYYNTSDKKENEEASIFKNYKNNLIDEINNFDKHYDELILIRNEILKANSIYIFSSYEVEEDIITLVDFLQLVNKKVIYSKSKKMSGAFLSNISVNDLQLYFVAGVDNNYLSNIYETIKNESFKKIIISSSSQYGKFKNPYLSVNIKYPKENVNIYNKKIHLIYILKQLINLIVEGLSNFDINQKYLF